MFLAKLKAVTLAGVVITWVPLLLISVLEGRAWGSVEVPFLINFEVHARMLLALPGP